MGLFSKKTTKSASFTLKETNTDLQANLPYTVEVDSDAKTLTIKNKKITRTLKFESITECDAWLRKVDDGFKKEWGGRAIAGGIIAGKTGAIIGATTGDLKKKEKIEWYIELTFQNGERFLKFVEAYQQISTADVCRALHDHFSGKDNGTVWD